MTGTNTWERAQQLKALHESSEILRAVNVWDAMSAATVGALPETKAIATVATPSPPPTATPTAACPWTSRWPRSKLVDAVDLPVTADLDDGYDNPAETIRRAIVLGVVGANVEDRLRPFDEAVARVEAIMAAANDEGASRSSSTPGGGDRAGWGPSHKGQYR
jgi:2-methylisocitrate lyase-like PEP mutase family enzyme